MKKKAVVLGCGLVGATMVRDLASDDGFEVIAADLSADNLRRLAGLSSVVPKSIDLSDGHQVRQAIAGADVVLGALPSRLGFQTLRTVLESRKPYADISFMAEDALELDSLAKSMGVAAVVDCGVSPGLSNLIVGFVHAALDRTDRAEIYVGGLPKQRRWPYEYKAPFAPLDVIEEYTRPARMVEAGRLVVKPALSEPELIDVSRVGTLEGFNTDGLRSLLKTVRIPTMKEKTLRYPGHAELMRVLRETGFFQTTTIDVKGTAIRPLDVTAKLLFPLWTYQPGEEEFTVLRVVVAGEKKGRSVCHTFEMYDESDRATGTSSMARTTAFPCTIVARMLARGEWSEAGVFPPELLGARSEVFTSIVEALRRRGVAVESRLETS
jgi:saccharopine dehydrogenase-like NADP-dependent oxidoreductase